MDVIDAIYTRRSVRDYAGAPLDEADITALIDAAIQAPNAMNRQAWRFTVVTDRGLLDKVSDSAKAFLLKGLGRAAEASPVLEHLSAGAFNIFYNAPVLVVICAESDDPMTAQDCCLAAQNLMLAAHARGLGTCWIGFAEQWLAQPEGKRQLGVPGSLTPIAPIILGRPESIPPSHGRKAAIIDWVRPER